MKGLDIADGLSLPIEAVTGTDAILATKGAGKSNAAVVMAEEMFKLGVPFVAVDPKGDWHGIRAAGDGGPGLPIPVFGGRHGDVPLEATAGALIADLVLKHRLTCVLDVSQFTKADTTRFLLAFARHLFAHADDDGAEPLHLFLEEAHEYLPQVVKGDQAELVNVWQRIVKQGRFKGLGVTMISQRSSVLNKDVLELIDTLIVLRTIGPLSRKSIGAWVAGQDVDPKLLDSLPSLKDGEAWIWSPGALNLLRKVQFRRRHTFDSGATPKMGEKRRTPGTITDVDLAAIKDAMAETIEKAKADDPKELRKQIKQLERQNHELLTATSQPMPAPEPEIITIEVPVVDEAAISALRDASLAAFDIHAALETFLETLPKEATHDRQDVPRARPASDGPGKVERLVANLDASVADARAKVAAQRTAQRPDPTPRREPRSAPVPRPAPTGDIDVGKGERAILTVVAQFGSATRELLTVMLGYKRSSRNTYIQRLATAGLVTAPPGDRVYITDAGRDYLGDDYEPLPTGPALQDFWLEKLAGGEKAILAILINHYPLWMERADLDEPTGYQRSSRNTYLQRLRSRELIDVDGTAVRASAILFE